MSEKNVPIPLRSPDGRVFAYACPNCLEVGGLVGGGGSGEEGRAHRSEWSRERAEQCCRCRDCGVMVGRLTSRCGACERAAREKRDAYFQSAEFRAHQEATARAAATFEASVNPSAARLLAQTMSDISESYYCAGWMHGLEYSLWHMLQGGDRSYGFGTVTDEEIAQLRYLSDQAGGWVRYDIDREDHSGYSGEVFMPLAEWTQRYDTYERKDLA